MAIAHTLSLYISRPYPLLLTLPDCRIILFPSFDCATGGCCIGEFTGVIAGFWFAGLFAAFGLLFGGVLAILLGR